jgi:hypothetical protein
MRDVKAEVKPRFPQQQYRKIGIKFKEETFELLHFEHKGNVKLQFYLEQAIAQRGSRGIALLFL